MWHETLWSTQHARTPPPPRHHVARARLAPERGRAPGARVGRRSRPAAAGLADRRRGGLGPQAGARTIAQVDRPAVRTVATPVAARRHSARFSPRALDLATHCGRDAGTRWG